MKTVVFFVNLAPYGGIETVFFYYAKILSEQYKVKLVSPHYLPKNICQQCKINNIEYSCCASKAKWYHPFKYIPYKISKFKYQRYLQKLNLKDCIIVDFKNGESNQILKQISRQNSKTFLWIHGGMPFVEEYMKDIDYTVYDRIVCLTDSLREKLINFIPSHKDKIIRIYNPLDLEKIQQQSLENVNEVNYFTHISRVSTDKDFKTLIDGYEIFYNNTQSQTPLYIIGDGSQKKKWEEYAAKKNAASQIKFLGKKENPFPYMKNAKAVLLSSPAEGLGCVLIEALACTKGVVVASDCPDGPKEILGNGKYGVTFTVGASQELADILQQIDENKLTHNMFTNGLEQHMQKFSLTAAKENLQKIF